MDKISVQDLIKEYKEKKVTNTKTNPTAVSTFIADKIEFTTYVPFQMKREIAETVVNESVKIVDGLKVVDSISQYISFVIAMLVAHTNLDIGDPYEDYDALCETGLIGLIIAQFKTDYDECDAMVKMKLADEMQDNTTPAIIAGFLDSISENLGDFSEVLKEKLGDLNLSRLLDSLNLSSENTDLLNGLLNK